MNKRLIHTVFDAIAEQFPFETAIDSEAGKLTYEQLQNRSEQLAYALVRNQVQKGSRVLVLASPGSDLITMILGIFKAGGVYVPIDQNFGEKRLKQVFDEAFDGTLIASKQDVKDLQKLLKDHEVNPSTLLLVNGHQIEQMEPSSGELRFSEVNEASQNELPILEGTDNSYIFYTSGSTGKAKGIIGRHESLSQFIHWQIEEFNVGEGFRVSQLIQPTFDASLRDIFVPLCAGGTLCIPSLSTKNNFVKLWNWIRDAQVSLMHTVPSIFRQLSREAPEDWDASNTNMKHLIFSGEPLFAKDVQNCQNLLRGVEVVNFYGMTETTMIRAFHRVTDLVPGANEKIPAGKPIAKTSIAIINGKRLCRVGEIGEIYIKSPFFSNGYLNTDLNQEVFVQNPLVEGREDIVYKTGDLGRYKKDKTFEVLGRMDNQVKINGVRLDLSEVEKVALELHEIEEVYLKTCANKEGSIELLGYFTGEKGAEETLKHHLRNKLGTHAVPGYLMHLDRFPLNLNGKIDGKALPDPSSLAAQEQSYEAPRGKTEETLAEIWKTVLGLEKVGRRHSFFDLGGHSLRAIRLVSNIYKAFDVQLKLADVFEHKTLEGLANLIENEIGESCESIPKAEEKPHYPLSHGQKRLWAIHQMENASQAYVIPSAFHLKGNLDLNLLQLSLSTMSDRYEILRTRFPLIDGQPAQLIEEDSASTFAFTHTVLNDHDTWQNTVKVLLDAEYERYFDLENGPLWSAHLITCETEEQVLIINMHHILTDAWSSKIFFKELITCYQSLGEGNTPDLSPLKLQYRDYSEWQHGELQDVKMQEAADYWSAQFEEEILSLDLPVDNPRSVTKSYEGGNQILELTGPVVDHLREACKTANTTLFAGLLAAVKALLYRYTHQKDLIVGVPVSGRDHPELENQIGFFVNTLALRSQVDPDQSFVSFLSEVQQTILNGFKHQFYPFDKLINEISYAPDPSRSPLFDVMVDVQEVFSEDEIEVPDGQFEVTDIGGAAIAKFDLLFNFTVKENKIVLTLTYDKGLYKPSSAQRMTSHFEQLLTSLLSGNVNLDAASYLDEPEREQLFSRRGTALQVPEGSIADWLEQKKESNQTAIIDGNIRLSYAQLVRDYKALAGYLILKAGIVKGDYVALIQGRSAQTISSMLGILRSGATFVPMDPELPKERIAHMLKETGCRVIVSDTVKPEDYDLTVVAPSAILDQEISTKELPTLYNNDIAYVIYTSGSTGNPKGVLVGHGALANYAYVCQSYFGLSASDKVLHQSSIAFDTFVEEIFPVLIAGGQVIIHAEGGRDIKGLVDLVQQHQVSVVSVTPLIINELNKQSEKLGSVHTLISGGDRLLPGQIDHLWDKMEIYNTYGPSETTVCATYAKVDHLEKASLIGEAIPNTEVLVLDRNQCLVPVGIQGEIYIGGAGVSKGYLNDLQSTAKNFIIHPFREDQILYKTGDLGKWTSDGLMFIGRNDDQVKVRGYRIELTEIEKVVQTHPDVQEAAAVKLQDRLVCYYVGPTDESTLIKFVQDRLPFYMIPAQWVVLDQLPMTISGKIDRRNLPDPGALNTATYEAPKLETEKLMATVWEKVLGKTKVGVTDNFYELGGDSIKAIQVVSRLHQEGLRLEVKDILTYPTIRVLAPMSGTAKIKATLGEVTGTICASPIHQAFFETNFRYPDHYNQSVLLYTAKGWNIGAIEEAFKTIVNHHDGLRSIFKQSEDVWDQHIGPSLAQVSVKVLDFFDDQNPSEAMLEAANELQSSFNLSEGPLFKLGVFRHEEGAYLLIVAHHLLVDGVSWRIIMEDFGKLYGHLISGNGQDLSLPNKTSSLVEWMEALQQYANSSQAKQQLTYWESVMEQMEEHVESSGSERNLASRMLELDESYTQQLQREVHVPYKTKTDELLMTATLSAMQRAFKKTKWVVALEGHGRESVSKEIDINRTVGWFTSVFPVVLQSSASETKDRIIETKEVLRKIPNNGFDFGVLKYLSKNFDVSKLQTNWSADLSFNYLGEFGFSASDGYFSAVSGPKGRLRNAAEKIEYPLSLDAYISDGRLTVAVAFDDRSFTSSEIDLFMISLEEEILVVIDHCSETAQTVATPSDFEYSDLSLEELDTLFD